jgi:hypothetical protein
MQGRQHKTARTALFHQTIQPLITSTVGNHCSTFQESMVLVTHYHQVNALTVVWLPPIHPSLSHNFRSCTAFGNWREQRPSNQGGLGFGVIQDAGRVCYGVEDLFQISFLRGGTWLIFDCTLNSTPYNVPRRRWLKWLDACTSRCLHILSSTVSWPPHCTHVSQVGLQSRSGCCCVEQKISLTL